MKIIACLLAVTLTASAADEVDLSQKLSNPVSDLISLPVQSNIDFGLGPGDGTKWTTNIQPVIPIAINDDWNVVSRTILPVIEQSGLDATGDASDAFGLGDVVQSFFFSPKESDLIWGVGPAMLLPTATDSLLGTEQWAAGPTAVVLKQTGPWTYGALANHLWSYAGDEQRGDINATFLQPFVSYTTPAATTISLNAESTYDWNSDQWVVPVNFSVAQLVKIGSQPVQFFAGVRYYAEKPENGPEWGVRFGVTFLFPK